MTPRDSEVLIHVLDGFPRNKELAEILETTVGTAGKDVARIFHQLHLEDRAQMARFLTICSFFRSAW